MRKDDEKIRASLLTRRKFLEGGAASAAALTLMSRPSIADAAAQAPAGKRIKLGCIGVGAQGTRVMMDFLKIPDVQVVDAGADTFDDPGRLDAEDERRLSERVQTGAVVDIDVVDASRCDSQKYLGISRRRFWNLLIYQSICLAVIMDANRLHAGPPYRVSLLGAARPQHPCK